MRLGQDVGAEVMAGFIDATAMLQVSDNTEVVREEL